MQFCQGHKVVVTFLSQKVSVDGIHHCIQSALEDKYQQKFNDTVLKDIIAAMYPLH